MNEVFALNEEEQTPDVISKDYRKKFRGKKRPIVVDNGSYACRVGWAGESAPRYTFRSQSGKLRTKKQGRLISSDVVVGNMINENELLRYTARGPHDRDVAYHMETQEYLFDHMFTLLGIEGKAVNHPIIMTEAVCIPGYSRSKMSELLFECYGVPSVCYGIDSMFSFYHNFGSETSVPSDGLIISSGQNCSHVLPICNGFLDTDNARRISLGGYNFTDHLYRLLCIKYPQHRVALAYPRARYLKENYGYMAVDYWNEVSRLSEDEKYREEIKRTIQLPFVLSDSFHLSEEERARREEVHRRAGERLREMAKKRRSMKLQENYMRKTELEQILELSKTDEDEFQDQLMRNELESKEDLLKTIEYLNSAIEKAIEKEKQVEEGPKENKQETEDEILRRENPDLWLEKAEKEREELRERIEKKSSLRAELNDRRSRANRLRLKMIADAAFESEEAEDNEATFGQEDDDWNVYRYMAKDVSSEDEEEDHERLKELDRLIGEMTLKKNREDVIAEQAGHHQVELLVERCRAAESLFQPSLAGSEQAGLGELLGYLSQMYDVDTLGKMMKHVHVTGGSTLFPNFSDRLYSELRMLLPVDMELNISMANDAIVDSWRGASEFALRSDFSEYVITREAYEESGGDRFITHCCSNSR